MVATISFIYACSGIATWAMNFKVGTQKTVVCPCVINRSQINVVSLVNAPNMRCEVLSKRAFLIFFGVFLARCIVLCFSIWVLWVLTFKFNSRLFLIALILFGKDAIRSQTSLFELLSIPHHWALVGTVHVFPKVCRKSADIFTHWQSTEAFLVIPGNEFIIVSLFDPAHRFAETTLPRRSRRSHPKNPWPPASGRGEGYASHLSLQGVWF